jgi:hemolysin III
VPEVEAVPRVKPRLRGVVHQYAFFAALAAGVPLVLYASDARERTAAAIFGGSVAAMFGASALYHRPTWSPRARAWLCRLDHAMIYVLIAGTYTPFGLLVLQGAWRTSVLTIVWSGAAAAILQKLVWVEAPKWLAATIGLALGWIGVIVFPKLYGTLGVGGAALLIGGGLMYTAGAVVYALRRPDPSPATFGYHEIFHVLVAAAVVCQYSAIAFFVLAD